MMFALNVDSVESEIRADVWAFRSGGHTENRHR